MTLNGNTLCRLAALIVFVLVCFGVGFEHVNMLALGLALWVLSTFL